MDYVKAITNQNKNLKTDVIIKSLNEHFQKLIKFRKTKHASLCKYFIIPYIYYIIGWSYIIYLWGSLEVWWVVVPSL